MGLEGRRKKAAPQWVFSSGGLSRRYSTLDPSPTKNPPQHLCIFLVSCWPLTACKAVFGNSLLTLHTRPHRPPGELFRFWLSTLFFLPIIQLRISGIGGSWMSDTEFSVKCSLLGVRAVLRAITFSDLWLPQQLCFPLTKTTYKYVSL